MKSLLYRMCVYDNTNFFLHVEKFNDTYTRNK